MSPPHFDLRIRQNGDGTYTNLSDGCPCTGTLEECLAKWADLIRWQAAHPPARLVRMQKNEDGTFTNVYSDGSAFTGPLWEAFRDAVK